MKVLLALFLLFPLSALADANTAPLGNWTGTGVQAGESWAVEVQIVPGAARVDYPGLNCGGVWVFDTAARFDKGTEWLTYGKGVCLDGLAFTVSLEGRDNLMLQWLDDAGGVIAYAPLRREGRPTKTPKSGNRLGDR